MSETYLTHWALGRHFDDRDHFHDVALHEARVATERRSAPARTSPDSLASRIRVAIGRATPVDAACDSPAAA